jgi:hypothetical protein
LHFSNHPIPFNSQTPNPGDVACAFEELAAGGGIVPLLLSARALAIESDGHASVSHLGTCIAVLAARTSVIIKTPLVPAVAAAATAAAIQLTAAYHNRGRARLQFGWTDDAREDFVIAEGIASSSLRPDHRIRKVARAAARQAQAAADAAAKGADAAAKGADAAAKGADAAAKGADAAAKGAPAEARQVVVRPKKKRQKQKKGWDCLV